MKQFIVIVVVLAVAAVAAVAEPCAPNMPASDSGQQLVQVPSNEGALASPMPVLSPEPCGESRADTERAARLILSGQTPRQEKYAYAPAGVSRATARRIAPSGISRATARRIAERVNQANPLGGTPKSQAKVRDWLVNKEGFVTRGGVNRAMSNIVHAIQGQLNWLWFVAIIGLGFGIAGCFLPRIRMPRPRGY